MAVDGVTKEKKKKKKIKVKKEEEEAADGGNTKVMPCRDVSVQTGVKTELLERNARDGESEEKKRKKKKKKVKEEEEETTCHNASVQTSVKPESSEINISEASEKTIKKKKRKMKEEPELKEEEDGEHLMSKKKKAKKKGNVDEVKGIKNKKMKKEVEVKEKEVVIETVKKKKKRKKERELNTEDGETKKKIKKTEADKCVEEERKVKKKKKAPVKEEPDDIISGKEKPEKKSKKQKKSVKSEDEGAHANGGHVCSPDEPSGKKGRKEELKKTPEKVEKKFKEERDEALKKSATRASDIVFLSAKTGNQDEVSIDQARRLALQQDVDKESQPKPTLGQWGTAQFSSSAEQTKFLRLMGGLKKSSQPAAGSSARANMALGRDGQRTLQQGLLGQFERAQSHHMDFKIRGAGLGFAAPSNKTFTIDVNARNSVRFDD